MHIRLLAVGDRQPPWVDEAFDLYAARFPRDWKFRLEVIPTVRRQKNDRSQKAKQAEGDLILAKLNAGEQVVLLDERGRQLDSKALARKVADWQSDGRDLCFVIGGPDGVPESCRARAPASRGLALPGVLPLQCRADKDTARRRRRMLLPRGTRGKETEPFRSIQRHR